ncbi:hypothetical protein [Asticcacaulis sp. 201]|uniref:hypothetical protein n=1 Tax=Asticcacaulis sp. 201 TaxID=3028787 RepID=UPI0029163FAA|nr:hypothetical protein [Asticcacaulis sp. 201]MDV6329993.1 hypothetical protein [Asticcacaulis sp. 201]
MSSEPNGKRPANPIWLIVKGVALTVTGFLAASGMTFVCVIQNSLHPHHLTLKLAHEQPAVFYAALFAVMFIWLLIAARFSWRNRTRLGLSLSAIAFIVFAIEAVNVLKFAYPVCNAF